MSVRMVKEADPWPQSPYPDEFPPDEPIGGLPRVFWNSPEAELAALEAARAYDASPTGTIEEKVSNLGLYVQARRRFAEGTGLDEWVNGSLNRMADTGFLIFLDELRRSGSDKINNRITVLKRQTTRAKGIGNTALEAHAGVE